jgi:DNA-binding XRE family transcriptional regulator
MEHRNNLRHVRENKMPSKAELARRAGICPLTIDRIEKGMPSRISTRRKTYLVWDLSFRRDEECLGRTKKLSLGQKMCRPV